MYTFSTRSELFLRQCHYDLIILFNQVIQHIDCSVLCGNRGQLDQHKAFMSGASKVDWPDSPHNKLPSMAVDVVPYPIKWGVPDRTAYFGGFVVATAIRFGILIRWGHDWDRDHDLHNQHFIDSPHWEIVP